MMTRAWRYARVLQSRGVFSPSLDCHLGFESQRRMDSRSSAAWARRGQYRNAFELDDKWVLVGDDAQVGSFPS